MVSRVKSLFCSPNTPFLIERLEFFLEIDENTNVCFLKV